MFTWFIRKRRSAALALIVAQVGLPAAVGARETREQLEERVRRLERIIQENGLDKPRAKPSAATAEPAAPPIEKSEVEAIVDDKLKKQKVLAGWKDGFYLESPSGDFKMKLRGYLQTDARFFPLEEGDTGTDSIFLRRVRPIFEGTVYKYFDYRIMPDFGGGQTTLQDAYADITYFKPWTTLRSGKFKVPFSLERLQSGADLLFIERSMVQNLGPNRDIGFQLGGDLWDGALGYQVGAFNGAPDNSSTDGDTTSDKIGAARLFALPFKNTDIAPLKGLGLGVAGTFGNQKKGDNLAALRYNTPGRTAFFRYATSTSSSAPVTITADGANNRIDGQMYYYWGPFGMMGEYIQSTQGARRDSSRTRNGTTRSFVKRNDFVNNGWFLQASYVLTGEEATFKTLTPINPFDPLNGRWGAFEVAARGGGTFLDDDLFKDGFATRPQSTDQAWNWGLGVNWYFNRNFKMQVNWEHTAFATEVDFGGNLRDHEDVFLTRFQISY